MQFHELIQDKSGQDVKNIEGLFKEDVIVLSNLRERLSDFTVVAEVESNTAMDF
jgi:hypothetical protein